MQLRPELRIQTVIDAMTQVVIPAIDAEDDLAQEQAQLVVGMLGALAQWLPLEYRYDRDELTRLLATADDVSSRLNGGVSTTQAREQLAAVASDAHDVLRRAMAEPRELLDAVRDVRSSLGEAVRATFEDGEPQSQQAATESVLELSRH